MKLFKLTADIRQPKLYSFGVTVGRHRFALVCTTNLAANGNGNGILDATDFAIWRQATSAAGIGASRGEVPEQPDPQILPAFEPRLNKAHYLTNAAWRS